MKFVWLGSEERAVDDFQEAIRLDPGYAKAHAGLADAYIILANHHHRPSSEKDVERPVA